MSVHGRGSRAMPVLGLRLPPVTGLGRPFGLDLGPPTAAFALSTLTLCWTAIAAGTDFTSVQDWGRWDTALYLQIAHQGYNLVRCAPAVGYPLTHWCGTSGWFPGYPLLLAPFFSLHVSQGATAMAVPWLFDFALMVLLWNGFLRDLRSPSRYAALVFAAFVPGGVYLHADFPLSMTLFFAVLSLYWLRTGRRYCACTAGAVAVFCYPSALLLAAVVALWALVEPGETARWTRLARAVVSAGIVGLGLVAALAVEASQTGHWDAYFLVQASYNHGIHDPFALLWPQIRQAFGGSSGLNGAEDWDAVQVAFICLLVTGLTVRRLLCRAGTRWDALILVLMLGSWLVPLTQANLSWWREGVLLTPAALLVGELGLSWAAVIAGTSVAGFPMLAYFFFNNTLI